MRIISRPNILCLGLYLCAAWTTAARAEETITPPPAAIISQANPAAFDPGAATKAWLDTVPAEKRAKSDAYFEGGYWLILWNFLMTAAIALVLLASGSSARLRDLVERNIRSRPLQIVFFSIALMLIAYALGFPLAAYEQFFREHAYGMSTQTFGAWFREQLLALAVQGGVAVLALVGIYRAIRRAPRMWWLWATGGTMLFLPVTLILSPVFFEPLFNKYTPLTDVRISEPILVMARANQIPVKQVFEVDASRQTTRVSANVAGFLGTTRIALNDNLLNQCTLPEIREVMGHEMGHYVLNHGGKIILYSSVAAFVGFGLTSLLFNLITRKWGKRWDVRDIGDLAGLPLLWLILNALIFLATPISNTVIRVTEREADAFGLNTSREPDASASIALKLGQYRKLDPGPIEEFIFFDHPSGRARIRMAMDWKAAQLPCGDVGLTKAAQP